VKDRMIGPGGLPMHDIVVNDALAANYRALAALTAEQGRLWVQEHGQPLRVMDGDDPRVVAVGHLAAALVHIQQAVREQVPRAEQHYQAVLLIAGNLAREAPLATFRRPPTPPGRAA
jgi:hypothetical protein